MQRSLPVTVVLAMCCCDCGVTVMALQLLWVVAHAVTLLCIICDSIRVSQEVMRHVLITCLCGLEHVTHAR